MEQSQQQKTIIRRAQSGDTNARTLLINEHLPFIRQMVRGFVHRSQVESLDEYSIALQAFDTALMRYRQDTQMDFDNYARLLIKNRLIDWTRKEKLHAGELSLSQQDDESHTLQDKLPDNQSAQAQENLEFQESLLDLQYQMQQYQLDFTKLARKLPKHRDRKMLCIKMARLIDQDTYLCELFQVKKRLPATELSRQSGIKLKTIERNRASIIFYTLLLQSDMQQLKRNIQQFEMRNEHE